MIEIWQPRWKDRVVLVATYKVKPGKNLVRFTKTPSLPDVYSFEGDAAKKCPRVTNGRIECFAIPLSMLANEVTDADL